VSRIRLRGNDRDLFPEDQELKRPIAIAFGVDAESLRTARRAFPDWEIVALDLASSAALAGDRDPRAAGLLLVGARDQEGTVAFCRGLRGRLGRAPAALLVLVPAEHEALVRAVLEAGADGCLELPVHPKDLISSLARARGGNRPGRHTLNLDQAQREDSWRDEGGEG
jgi:DNA-binding NarL/FixJ family response regulator